MSIANGCIVVIFMIFVFIFTKLPSLVGLVVFLFLSFFQGVIVGPLSLLFQTISGNRPDMFDFSTIFSTVQCGLCLGAVLCLHRAFEDFKIERLDEDDVVNEEDKV